MSSSVNQIVPSEQLKASVEEHLGWLYTYVQDPTSSVPEAQKHIVAAWEEIKQLLEIKDNQLKKASHVIQMQNNAIDELRAQISILHNDIGNARNQNFDDSVKLLINEILRYYPLFGANISLFIDILLGKYDLGEYYNTLITETIGEVVDAALLENTSLVEF